MKKFIAIAALTLIVIAYSCSKSNSSSSGGTCFTCTLQSQVVKYCKKNETTATITYTGGSEEDNFENGWDKYVQETKEGARAAGYTCD